jgi:hypothetical protein
VTSCQTATGAWLCILSAFLYFGALVALLFTFPRSWTKARTACDENATYDSPVITPEKKSRSKDIDLEKGSLCSDKTQPTEFDTSFDASMEPPGTTPRNFESDWGQAKVSQAPSESQPIGETTENDGAMRLVMPDDSYDAEVEGPDIFLPQMDEISSEYYIMISKGQDNTTELDSSNKVLSGELPLIQNESLEKVGSISASDESHVALDKENASAQESPDQDLYTQLVVACDDSLPKPSTDDAVAPKVQHDSPGDCIASDSSKIQVTAADPLTEG